MALNLPVKGEADKKIGAYLAPLSVSVQDVPNMTVKIRAGGFYNAQNNYVEYAGGNTPAFVPPLTNAKWVIVALTDSGTVALVNGTPATAPSLPTLPAGHLPLASVYLTSTTTAIVASMVADIRPVIRSVDIVPNLITEVANRPTTTDLANAVSTKADMTGTTESSFTLNQDFTSGTPTADGVFAVMRGSAPTVSIRWNELADVWELTNDGITYAPIAGTAGLYAPAIHTHIPSDIVGFSAAVSAFVAATTLDTLSDVVAPSPTSGNVLTYNGTNWTPQSPTVPVHTHTKTAITDFVEADYVHATGPETIGGDKTFTGNVTIGGPTTSVTLSANTLQVTDKMIDINSGEVGAGVGGATPQDAGIRIKRGSLPDAVLQWNENTDSWQVGVIGTMDSILTGSVVTNKMDKAVGAVVGNLATFGVGGQVVDSTVNTASFVTSTALTTGLAGKANTVHNHVVADITDFATGIAGKANTVHTHVAADITDFTTEVSTAVSTALTSATGVSVQAFDADLTAIAGVSTTGLLTRTGAGTSTSRTITGTAGNVTVANGDGVAGDPTIDLPAVGTAVTASLVKITTDAQGRVSATAAVTASDITTLVDATYVNVSGDTMSGALAMGGNKVTGLAAATANGDAVRFDEYDTHAANADIHVDHTTVSVLAGTGLTGGGTIAVDRTINVAALKAAPTVAFTSVPANSTVDFVVAVTGTVVGDVVVASCGTLESGLVLSGFVATANDVTLRVANVTGAAIVPATQQVNVIVLQYGEF